MAKANKQVVIDDIIKEIEQGKSFDTCMKQNGTKWNLTRSTFIRRWNDAQQQYTELQDKAKEASDRAYIEASVEAAKGAIMSKAERQSILTQIARGELSVKKSIAIGGIGIEVVNVYPDFSDIKSAVAELNKMEGDYAPTKTALTDAEGKDKEFVISLNLGQ